MIRRFIIFTILTMTTALGVSAGESRMVTDTIYSKVLGAPRAYTAYLPPSFDSAPGRKFPVLYLLHGRWGNNQAWSDLSQLQMIADRLIRNGEMDEMVIVTPDADTGMGSDMQFGYFNVPGWNYEDFFFNEFVPQVEQKYRAGGSKGRRAVAGLSMGGGGAAGYAQHHPEMFAAAYPMSALMSVNVPGQKIVGGNDKFEKFKQSVIENDHIKYVADADDARKEALRSVKWYVDCGDDDHLLRGNLEFYKAMLDAGIPCELRVRDGSHNFEYWNSALPICLPFVSRAFNRE